jgi:cellulase/cellobiase CelA1
MSRHVLILATLLLALPASRAAAAPSYEATFAVNSSWASGFTAGISLRNTGTEPITDWTLAFDFDRTITNLWNGVILSHAGTRYTVDNAGWNGTIAPGKSVSFGFQGQPGAPPAPTNYELVLPAPPPPQFQMDYSIVSDWGQGFEASVAIRNLGAQPIEGWTLAFDLPRTVTQVWNAALGAESPTRPTFSSLSYNATIPAGGSVSYGFLASGSGALPGNVRLNGVTPVPEPAGAVFVLLAAAAVLARR